MAGINFCTKLMDWCVGNDDPPPPTRIPEAKDWISGDALKVTTELWMRYVSCVSECVGGPGYEVRGLMLGTGTMLCDQKNKKVTVLIPVLVSGLWKAGNDSMELEAELKTLTVTCGSVEWHRCCAAACQY
jgi:hypothetical protein